MTADTFSRQDVSALIQGVQRLCAARDIGEVVEIVRTSARRLVGSDGATFVVREGDQVFYVGEDAIAPLWQGKRFPASQCISGWAMLNRQSVAIPDIYADPRIPHDAYLPTFVHSLAMIPVNRKDPIAAIGVYWAGHHVTTARELELLQSLADATATAVANSELYRGLLGARTELEHAGTRLRLALEAGAIGTWDFDSRERTLTWDAKCRELFGVGPDDPVDYRSFVDHVHPEDRARVQAAVDEANRARSDGYCDIEYRTAPDADGGVRWLAARGRAQFDAAGEAVRFVGTVRDITVQKSIDVEKAELLYRANAANQAKDEFLAMLGHELRNPLAPIVTAIELLKLGGHTATREVTTIERQSRHLVRLVDDLLDIARVTRGKLELERAQVELRTVIAQAIEIASPLIERRRQMLTVAVEPHVIVDADPARLAQLIANLLTNAAKYTPESGQIWIEAQTRAQQLSLHVRDNGCGLDAEIMPQLFAPFVQSRQTSERSQGGLGLGLALARSLTELHGGTIRAQSAGPGQGSTFSLELPIVVQPHSRRTPLIAASERGPDPRALRILIVDDNQDAAELLATSLRNSGHLVGVALDPPEAMAALREAVADVAILDIGLPVMDGYELALRLRTELAARCPVLIALTGYGQEKDRRRSAESGFALHLVKPVQLSSVIEALEVIAPRLLRRGPDDSERAAE